MQSFRKKDGKTSTKVYRKLGSLNDLLPCFSNNQELLMAWAKKEAKKDTDEYNAQYGSVSFSLSQAAYIPKDEERSFNIGYLFLQQLCTELRLDNICRKIRPNPIVTMGLFMDADGIPLAFDIFPGNQNEQMTLKPLESKVMQDFGCSEFIFCSDSGLGSKKNRLFNSFGNRSYIITHSLKKMKADDHPF